MDKRILIAVGLLVLLIGLLALLSYRSTEPSPVDMATSTTATTSTPTQAVEIRSFKDCARAGYPIMESFPRQCRVPDGRVYAEEIESKATYINASPDRIRVDRPTPGAVTGKSFTVSGQARGNWYFEGSFPVELLDKNGTRLALVPAPAETNWMVETFVPFSVVIAAPSSYIGPATLVLHRDNPSGLPEYDASVSIPITIEY